eukprot:3713040-Amphidinium_carterae.1
MTGGAADHDPLPEKRHRQERGTQPTQREAPNQRKRWHPPEWLKEMASEAVDFVPTVAHTQNEIQENGE